MPSIHIHLGYSGHFFSKFGNKFLVTIFDHCASSHYSINVDTSCWPRLELNLCDPETFEIMFLFGVIYYPSCHFKTV